MLSVKGDSRAQVSHPPLRRYYFHIASEVTVHTDDSGVVLSDLAAAHRHAVSAIWNYIRFDTGRTLVIVLFSAVQRKALDANGASG
jgi:hypothetical protein